jgi:hypothetical protein
MVRNIVEHTTPLTSGKKSFAAHVDKAVYAFNDTAA